MSGPFAESVIGLGIGVESLRAVCVRAGHVTWSREIALEAGTSMEDSLDDLLASVPRQPLGRVRVVAAVGPARSQLRHLRGLPPVKSPALLSSLVRQDPARFFVQNGVPVVTTNVQQVEDGTAWAGAIEQPVVEALERACRRRRLRSLLVVPTAAVLHRVIRDERIEWRDGSIAVTLVHADNALQECRREMLGVVDDGVATEHAPGHPDDMSRFADAIGAAVVGTRAALVHRPSAAMTARAGAPAWRVAVAGACAMLATAFAIAAPGIAATRASARMSTELTKIASASAAAVSTERQLAGSVLLLSELARFDRSARSTTIALASLTRAIRPPSMLLSIRLDSAGGTIVALTPRAMTLLEMLTHVPELSAPSIVGPVLPAPASTTNGLSSSMPGVPPTPLATTRARMELVTIRFIWATREARAFTGATR